MSQLGTKNSLMKIEEGGSMPAPKFSQFLETYSKISEVRSENKTYLFKKLKAMDDEKKEPLDSSKLENSRLEIFAELDKSTLQVIRGI